MARSVTFILDSLAVGGAELHTLRLARHLTHAGIATSLIVYSGLRSPAVLDADLPERTVILGRGSMSRDPAGWVRAADAVKSLGTDLVVAVDPAAFSVAAIGKRLRLHRVPLLCILHNSLPGQGVRWRVFRRLLRTADGVVFVSENQRRRLDALGYGCRNAQVIRNGIDLETFSPPSGTLRTQMREALAFAPGDRVIGLVGQFRPEKNQHLLLQAAAMLRAGGLPARILFVGDGPTRNALEAEAAARGLGDIASFVGERRDVPPFLAAMDVAVLCSAIETMPLAAIEALACAVPVILPDAGGASEIVTPGRNGFLYPPGQADALAAQLRTALEVETWRRLKANARESVLHAFCENQMLEQYERLVRSC